MFAAPLARRLDLSSRAHDLGSRTHDLSSRTHDLGSRRRIHKAITLHLPTSHGPTHLLCLIEHWRRGPFVQACATLPSVAILRISRFQTLPDDSVCKLTPT